MSNIVDHHTKLLRPLVFLMMIKFKHREVISRCKAMSDHITSSEEEIPPELRSVLYYCAMERDEEDVVKSFIRVLLYRRIYSTLP